MKSMLLKIKNKISKNRNSLTFKIGLLIIIFFVPVNIVFFISSRRMVEKGEQQVQLTTQNITDVYVNTLDMRMERADYYLYSFYEGDTDFITLRTTDSDIEYANSRYRAVRTMDKERSLSSDIAAFYAYIPSQDDYLVSSGAYDKKEKFVKYLKENMDSKRRWMLYEIDGAQYLVRTTSIRDVYYGAFLSLGNAKKQIEESINYKHFNVSFDSKEVEINSENQVAAVTNSKYADMHLVIKIPKGEIRENLSMWEKAQIVVAFWFVCLLPLLYIFIRHWMLRPLKNLNTAHYELEVGNEDYRIKDIGNSAEFKEAYRSFNRMADNIHSLELENVEKELAREKLRLNNLQLQIRPHFLLNTFNLMFNLAAEKETDSIKELVIYLSNYFRHIFRSGKELELFEKELKLIEGYMHSVQVRYPNTIFISYQIDPEIYMVRVPPLLLHNFIENAVSHAVIKGSSLHIVLQAEYTEGFVTFTISDDGAGMHKDRVDEINSGEFEEFKGGRVHVGLQNSVMRIKYFYGKQAKIEVSSEPLQGTVFIISFPYNLEET